MFDIALSFNELSLVVPLLLAMVLGLLIGVERTIAGKEAGMRTFALVTLGSCLFVLVSEMVLQIKGITTADPMRLAANIVMGIGFLGAGLIIFQQELKGLTTDAALWVAAGIGMAVGFRLYFLAIFATFLTLFIFVVMWHIEHFIGLHVQLPELPDSITLENETNVADEKIV